jgi:hypothetical protein
MFRQNKHREEKNMNEMQVFQNSEFGELGVLEVNGKP